MDQGLSVNCMECGELVYPCAKYYNESFCENCIIICICGNICIRGELCEFIYQCGRCGYGSNLDKYCDRCNMHICDDCYCEQYKMCDDCYGQKCGVGRCYNKTNQSRYCAFHNSLKNYYNDDIIRNIFNKEKIRHKIITALLSNKYTVFRAIPRMLMIYVLRLAFNED